MRLLLVEDEDGVVQNIEEACADIPGLQLVRARDMAEAVSALDNELFDLVICDLRIPPRTGELASEEHGRAAYEYSRLKLPGTPVVIFSAYGTLRREGVTLTEARRGMPLGTLPEISMATFFAKDELIRCVEFIHMFAAGLEAVDGIELDYTAGPIELARMERRVIRLFARRYRGEIVHCRGIKGGLTGAKTLALEVRAGDNELMGRVFAKLDDTKSVMDEARRYEAHVPTRLPVGSFATFICEVIDGAGAGGGIFYRLLDDAAENLFRLLSKDPLAGAAAVERLEAAVSVWSDAAPRGRENVRDVRRRFLDDREFASVRAAVDGIEFDAIEGRQVQTVRCSQHGDLHGANVLINGQSRPYMIDFGRTATYNAATDPITLQLSLLFHPDGRAICGGWPSSDQARRWSDPDAFAASSPFSDFTRSCFAWARRSAAGEGEIAASAYGYALRQIQYPDTSRELASAVLGAAAEILTR